MRDNTNNSENRDRDRSGRTGSDPRRQGRSYDGNRESSERRDYNRRDSDRRGYYSDSSERRDHRGGSSDRRDYRRDSGERRDYRRDSDENKRDYRRDSGERRDYRRDSDQRRSYRRDSDDNRRDSGERRDYRRDSGERREFRRDSDDNRRDYRRDSGERRDYRRDSGERKEFRRDSDDRREFRRDSGDRQGYRRQGDRPQYSKGRYGDNSGRQDSRFKGKPRRPERPPEPIINKGWVRLNKFLADAGVCSRREADKLIEAGAVTINGKVVSTLGTRVLPEDKVQYGGETLNREKTVYLLLNKPKGFITTVDDPQGRNTVMSLISGACRERIYPVGRLDRNTTGLLLFTNDGEMAKKLTHPSHQVRKIYHVALDKNVTKADMLKIADGLELEDGHIAADEVAYTNPDETKKEVGIQLHSGRNRIVRRIFEHLGYDVIRLDRVVFGPLSKKDLPRGNWRILNEKEVNLLKHFT